MSDEASVHAVVLSATLRTFPETKAAAATLDVTTTNMTLFWSAITSFHKRANDYVDKGMFVYYEVFVGRFHVYPLSCRCQTLTKNLLLPVDEPLAIKHFSNVVQVYIC